MSGRQEMDMKAGVNGQKNVSKDKYYVCDAEFCKQVLEGKTITAAGQRCADNERCDQNSQWLSQN